MRKCAQIVMGNFAGICPAKERDKRNDGSWSLGGMAFEHNNRNICAYL